MKNDIKIIPRAANAFLIEVCRHTGEIAYQLYVNSDGQRLSILVKDKKDDIANVLGYTGLLEQERQNIKFNYLHIEGISQ